MWMASSIPECRSWQVTYSTSKIFDNCECKTEEKWKTWDQRKKKEGRELRKGAPSTVPPLVRSLYGCETQNPTHLLVSSWDWTCFLSPSIWSAHMATGKSTKQRKGTKNLKLSNEGVPTQTQKESCCTVLDFKELRDSVRSSGYCPTFLGLGVMHRMKKVWLLQNRRKEEPFIILSSVLTWEEFTYFWVQQSAQHRNEHFSPSQLGCEVLQRLLEFGHQCRGPGLKSFAPGPQIPLLTVGSFSLLENVRHHLERQRNLPKFPLLCGKNKFLLFKTGELVSLAPCRARNHICIFLAVCKSYIYKKKMHKLQPKKICSIPKCPSVEQNFSHISSSFPRHLSKVFLLLTWKQKGLLGNSNRDLHPQPLQYLEAALGEDIQHL